MKKQINAFRLLTLAGFLMLSLFTNANNAHCEIETTFEKTEAYFSSFTYSWSAEPNATNYTLEIVNTSTQESFSWTISGTTISAFSVPNGTYDLKVTAHLSSSTDLIIIEEIVVH